MLRHSVLATTFFTFLCYCVPCFANASEKHFFNEIINANQLTAAAHLSLEILGVIFLTLCLAKVMKLTTFTKRTFNLKISKKETHTVLNKNLLKTPALALSAAKHEIMKMGRDAQNMVQESLESVFHGEPKVNRDALSKVERSLDDRYVITRQFLAALMEKRLPEREGQDVLLSMRTLHDIEQIADIVEDRIIPRVEILRDNGIMLSEAGRQQLQQYHTKVLKQVSRSLDLFDSPDSAKAAKISERFERYCMLSYELKDQHFKRLQNHVTESEQTTNVHLNLLSALFDISNLATNIARHMRKRSASTSHKTEQVPATLPSPQIPVNI